jgi:hypothetical protein
LVIINIIVILSSFASFLLILRVKFHLISFLRKKLNGILNNHCHRVTAQLQLNNNNNNNNNNNYNNNNNNNNNYYYYYYYYYY